MDININELEILLEGLVMLDNVNSLAFSNYGITYEEIYEKFENELKSKS